MKKIIIVFVLCILGTGLYAQDYRPAIGIPGGYVSGVTVKHFTDNQTALEGILSFGRWGFNFTGLYELHAPAFDVERLHWFYGAGAHIGQWNDDYPTLNERGTFAVVGLDAIIGLEYDIEDIPFTLSADWKPTLNLTGFPGFLGFGGALTIRYTL